MQQKMSDVKRSNKSSTPAHSPLQTKDQKESSNRTSKTAQLFWNRWKTDMTLEELSVEALKVLSAMKNQNNAVLESSMTLLRAVSKGGGQRNECSTPKEAPKNERYKTELCRKFMENGTCPYGKKCQFSHGYHELRPVTRHPRYRTVPCREYFNTGLCTYGTRCNFIHDEHNTSTRNKSSGTVDPPVVDPMLTEAMDSSDRPFTPTNDSGFCFGSLNPSFSSTPSSIGAYSPIEGRGFGERAESPNELCVIPEEGRDVSLKD